MTHIVDDNGNVEAIDRHGRPFLVPVPDTCPCGLTPWRCNQGRGCPHAHDDPLPLPEVTELVPQDEARGMDMLTALLLVAAGFGFGVLLGVAWRAWA